MNLSFLPTVNASLNSVSLILILIGYRKIKAGDRLFHKKMMLTALVVSALFLASYITYHYSAKTTPYPYHDWTRPIYFAFLIPHIILAALIVPFILFTAGLALKEKYEKHARLAKFVWPAWVFVSLSGIVVYLMLYHL